MVPSLLPLAICFPSGLHATDQTLNLREANTRIKRHKQEKLDKNVQVRVPGQRALANVQVYIF